MLFLSPSNYNNNANVREVDNDGNLNNNNVNNVGSVRPFPTKISKVLMHRVYMVKAMDERK